MAQKIRTSGSSLLDLGDVMQVTGLAGRDCAEALHSKIVNYDLKDHVLSLPNTNSVTVKCYVPACYDCEIEVKITVDQELARRWNSYSRHPGEEN